MTAISTDKMVYLDHNATTPPCEAAVRAMVAAMAIGANASSVHRAGRAARALLRQSEEVVARAIGMPAAGSLVFTGGGTEANHLALLGFPGASVARSAIEHDSVRAALPDAAVLPVGRSGVIDLAALDVWLGRSQRPALVSVMAANNETGAVQPIAEIAARVHAQGGLFHCDAIQAVGKLPLDMAALGIDLLSLSAHKFGGPMGVGALALAPGIAVTPLFRGGGQQAGSRAGTENLPGIAGLASAIAQAVAELETYAGLAALRDRLEQRLVRAMPGTIVIAPDAPRLPNTSCIALEGLAAETQVMALDLDGICVSAGAACSSGKVQASHVLLEMGFPPSIAGSAIRISLGRDSTVDDIDRLVASWTALVGRRRARTAAASA